MQMYENNQFRVELYQPVSARVAHRPTVLHHMKPKARERASRKSFNNPLARIPLNKYVMFGLALVSILLFVFFTHEVVKAIIFVLMLVLASYSTIYKRKLGLPIGGPELITFGTVLTGVAYGPWAGLLFGLISSTASEIISAGIGPTTWVYILTAGGAGIISGYLHPYLPILVIGMAVTIFFLVANQLIFFIVGDPEIKAFTAFYIVANIIFNLLIFGTLAERTMMFMTLSM